MVEWSLGFRGFRVCTDYRVYKALGLGFTGVREKPEGGLVLFLRHPMLSLVAPELSTTEIRHHQSLDGPCTSRLWGMFASCLEHFFLRSFPSTSKRLVLNKVPGFGGPDKTF